MSVALTRHFPGVPGKSVMPAAPEGLSDLKYFKTIPILKHLKLNTLNRPTEILSTDFWIRIRRKCLHGTCVRCSAEKVSTDPLLCDRDDVEARKV